MLTLVTLLTSPVKNITWAAIFFGLLLVFLISAGYLLSNLQSGGVSSRGRYRIWVISLCLVVFLMFRSAQSLNWVDGVILALIVFGLLFYGSRRPL